MYSCESYYLVVFYVLFPGADVYVWVEFIDLRFGVLFIGLLMLCVCFVGI